MDSQTSAMVSLIGMMFDAVGGLYLAYDLLGGEKGPLSTFTRIFTYSFLISTIYSLTMGLRFGLCAGIALGTAVGLQLDRLGRGVSDTHRFSLFVSLIRGLGMGSAVLSLGRPVAAAIVGAVVFTASMVLPIFSISPAILLESGSKKPNFNKSKLVLMLTFLGLALFCDVTFLALGLNSQFAIQEMTKMTFTVVMAIFFVSLVSPAIEWYADNVEPRVLGYFGAVLFIIGFFIQSLPSLLVVLK